MKHYASILVLVILVFAFTDCQYQPTWDSLDKRPLPDWYDEAKVGIFMHWGVYSVPSFGSEWFWYRWKGTKEPTYIEFMEKNYPPGFSYADFAPMFKAEFYDPTKWAALFQQSGAKYVVLTSKHHEGFTNWPSKTSWNWNAMDTGPHRDLVGDLAAAIRNNTDIHFGLYFSQFEWFNPLFLQDEANNYTTQTYVKEVSYPQMFEIVNGYKPELIWSDGAHGPDTYFNATNFLAWLYNESPVKDTVVVNDRWGTKCSCTHGGYFTCHDRYNPHTLQNHKWENAFTIDRHSWGFVRASTLEDYLSIEEIIEQVVTTVSCGGNALINIGPTHDGRIVPIFEERLTQLGTWLKMNGDAIYSTKPWKHQNDSSTGSVWYTSGSAVYAIALEWPDNNIIKLGSIQLLESYTATLIGHGDVKVATDDSGDVEVTLPSLPLNTPLRWAWVIAFTDVAPK